MSVVVVIGAWGCSRDTELPDLGSDAGPPDAGAADLGGDAADDAGDAAVVTDAGADATVDAGPDCTGVATCTASGATCDGDTRVVCGRDPSGCLVETRTDCTTTPGGACSTTGGARCTVDPCYGLPTACATEGRSCTGDTLVTCAPNASGCLVSTTFDCAASGSTCDPMPTVDGGVGPAACGAPDPCFGVVAAARCPVAGRTCESTTTLADCHPNAAGCNVVTRTNCLAGRSSLAYCDATATPVACVDPCAGLTLCAPADPPARCVGAHVVTCTHDAAGCYVQADTSCAASGMGCDPSGATPVCSGALCPAALGTLSCTAGPLPLITSGDTAAGSTVLPSNACAPGVTYGGREAIWTLTSDVAAVAHVLARPVSDTTHPFDAFVLDGAAPCDTASSCLTSARAASSGSRTVDVSLTPGHPAYFVYDTTTSAATTTYQLLLTCDLCGDGAVTAPELCDDGNTVAGDGCDASCRPEPGWACSGAPSACHVVVCGNGVLEPGESCDDGNTVVGDGCSALCQVEAPASGGSRVVMGTLAATDPTYARDTAPCSATSPRTGVHYRTTTIVNGGASSVTLSVTAAWPGDGYLFAYTTFDPSAPATGCVTGNDDSGGTSGSLISGIVVAPGATVVVVATEYAPSSALGAFTLTITAS